MASKLSLFLAELKRRKVYFVAILLVLSCGGPEVPAELPQAMEWRFDEPQPDWQTVTPWDPPVASAEVSRTGDALRLTLTERTRSPTGHPGGGVYTDLPDLNLADWAEVVIQVRSENEDSWIYAGFNLREESGSRDLYDNSSALPNPFVSHPWRRVVPDGTVQTYRIPVDLVTWGNWNEWEGPWKQFGVWFNADERLGSFDILSVSLVPKAAAHRVAESTVEKCAGLESLTADDLPNPTTVITFSHVDAAQTDGEGDWAALPEHCRIQGKMNERVGVNDQPYAIKFRMRLPTEWNGRFFFEAKGAGGQLGGAVGAEGYQSGLDHGGERPLNTALSLGYAVVTQNRGHESSINTDSLLNGLGTMGFDPQARLDHGYNAADEVTQAAKALVKAYYGRLPDRSYFFGGSNGGREGMMMSQRFPTYYDGIIALNPGINYPKAYLANPWQTQSLAEVARAAGLYDELGQPFLNKTFTDDDLVLVSDAVLEKCDTLDGLADGIVDNFPACTTDLVGPRLAELTCSGMKEPDCLSGPQVTALLRVQAGPRNSEGEPLYADWPWDAGIAQAWRRNRLGRFDAARTTPEAPRVGFTAAVFTTPPVPVGSFGSHPMRHYLTYNFDTDPQKMFATTGIYTESAWDFMMSSSTDLSAFRDRGGKLIIVSGVSGAAVSINDLIAWWNEVNSINGGTAGDFVRLFTIPGMGHRRGYGTATDRYDALSAIVDWVENGIAPDRIIGTARVNTPWPDRTRPLCPYPQQARYKGAGSIEVAENFDCVDVVRN